MMPKGVNRGQRVKAGLRSMRILLDPLLEYERLYMRMWASLVPRLPRRLKRFFA